MVSKVLAVVFAILVIPSVVLWWFQQDVVNTDKYMKIVTPLASDPRVQAELATVISVELRDDLDIVTMMDGAAQDLPPKSAALMRTLAYPMELAVDSYIRSTAAEVMGSEEFAPVWEEANRAAHAEAGDTIAVELGPIVEAVKADLAGSGSVLAPHIPAVDKEYVLLTSPVLEEARRYSKLMRALVYGLPIVAVILLAVALWLSREKLKILLIAAMGTTMAMLALGAATYVARDVVTPGTSIAVYTAFADSLRADIRWVLLISAVVALTVWVLKRRLTDRPEQTNATRRT